MQRFLITYDLHAGTEEEYEELIKALKREGAVRVQESVWYLKDEDGVRDRTELRDLFWEYMREGDKLLVVRFDEFSGRNSIARISES